MYLKAVELFGFKSFSDKTVVTFNPGITSIVGPNGCGKSNVSDAVRWVLGERSAKMLRGRKMDDVIFAGTSLRKPLNMAEVSLVIDNRDRVLSIEYEEVVLTRRIYRTGESEYFINKTPCRYKDIQDLIMDTGIGSHSYSMIEQGRIDHILQADPDERRFLIEEAAGISKYKSQKDEAIRKLERTEGNLLRLTDVVSEVERNIKYAERQAKRAEKYRETYEVLKQKEIQKAHAERRSLEKRFQELTENQANLAEEERRSSSQVESLKAAVLNLEKEEEEKLQELRFKESKRFEVKAEIQSRESSKEFNWEKIGEIKNQIETLEKEIQAIRDNKVQLTESIQTTETELEDLKTRHASFSEQYSVLLGQFEGLDNEISDLESKQKHYQNLAFERASKIAGLRNDIHQLEIQNTSLETLIKKNRESYDLLQEEQADYESRLVQLGVDIQNKKSSLHVLQVEHSDLLSQLESIEKRIEEKRESKETFLKEHQELASRIEILQELQSTFFEKEGLSPEMRGKLETFDFVGSFYRELSIEKGYEKVVEVVLGDLLKSLTVETSQEFLSLENELKEDDFVRLPILIKNEISSPKNYENIHNETGLKLVPLTHIVQPSPSVYRAVSYLFANTFFIEDEISNEDFLNLQRRYPEVRLIHRNGKIWGPGPVIYLKGNREEESFFMKQSEWEELLEKKNKKDNEIQSITDDIARLEKQLEEARIRTSDKLDRLRSVQFELEVDDRDIHDLKTIFERKSKEQHFYQTEENRIQSDIQEITERRGRFREELTGLENDEKEQKSNHETLREELKQKKEEIQAIYGKKSKEELEKATLDEKLKYTEDTFVSLKNQAEDEEKKQERYQQKIVEYGEKTRSIRSNNEQLEEELGNFRNLLGTEEIAIKELEQSRLALQDQKKTVSSEMDQEEKNLEEKRSLSHKYEMESREIEHLKTRDTERILQAYKIDITQTAISGEELEALDLAALTEEIESLREKVSSAGTVNLLAVEEYDELKGRYDFLFSQKSDLEKARQELLEAIRKINRTTRRLFEETFQNVRKNFAEFFKILFNGGQAELVMLEEGNPLDSGIDIFVRPPGKKNQNVSLLSGGEKALTAIALLFALFKMKPSPFSILDEVDAPLDEANIDRFLEVLKKFTENTQFIIVTHNRKTISMSASLYGVTMQEAGVSKIVSVKLQSQESEALNKSITEQSLSSSVSNT